MPDRNPSSTQSAPPVVSAIVPVYNHAPFLRLRLDSILQQTYQNFEIVLLDDASTDGSLELLQTYLPHPKITFLPNAANSGSAFKQWARGIGLARGRYIWIAESDDWADPRFLERLVPVCETHPKVGLAYCQSWAADAEGKIIGNASCWTEELDARRWQGDFINHGQDELGRFLTDRNTIPNASAVLLRKAALDAVGPLDTDFRLCGDWMLWVKILSGWDVAFVAESLNFWRFQTSHSRAASNGTLEWIEGERVLRTAAQILGLTQPETMEILHAFLKKCWQWQREYIEKMPNQTEPGQQTEADGRAAPLPRTTLWHRLPEKIKRLISFTLRPSDGRSSGAGA